MFSMICRLDATSSASAKVAAVGSRASGKSVSLPSEGDGIDAALPFAVAGAFEHDDDLRGHADDFFMAVADGPGFDAKLIGARRRKDARRSVPDFDLHRTNTGRKR